MEETSICVDCSPSFCDYSCEYHMMDSNNWVSIYDRGGRNCYSLPWIDYTGKKKTFQELVTMIQSVHSEPSQPSSDSRECVVCLEHESTQVFFPCGHACTCATCCKSLVQGTKKCPKCRSDILEWTRLYI